MSFSSDVKNEIINQKEKTKKQRIAMLAGLLCFGAKLSQTEDGNSFKFSTENPKIARKMYSLIKNDCEIKTELRVFRGKSIVYFVMLEDTLEINDLFHTAGLLKRGQSISDSPVFLINKDFIKELPEKKAFIKGAFLASGSVITPQKNCHLEIATSHQRLANQMVQLFEEFDLGAKIAMRKTNYVIYFKNNTDVTDVLSILGAYDALMEYHNIKIMKEMRNTVNRKINCDNANMSKMIEASMRQVEAIEKLDRLGVLSKLSQSLREIAEVRLKYKELDLKELGQKLSPPIGKSGVNHRLRKLVEEAEKYN